MSIVRLLLSESRPNCFYTKLVHLGGKIIKVPFK
jgi:hypothetical protein